MNRMRNLLTSILGLAALTALALVIVWLYRAQSVIPKATVTSSVPAAGSAAPTPTLPSLFDSPLPTPAIVYDVSPTPEPERTPWPAVVEGSGTFPRLVVPVPGPMGYAEALYLVEGSRARLLASLDTVTSFRSLEPQLSPDGRQVAFVFADREGVSRVVMVDMDTGEYRQIEEARGQWTGGKTGPYEEFTSVRWIADARLAYSKIVWPGSDELDAALDRGEPWPIQDEVWSYDLDTGEKSIISSGQRVYGVLGASPDGRDLYVTRLIPDVSGDRRLGFALLHLDSGELENLWPQEEVPKETYMSIELVDLPGGSQGLAFVVVPRGEAPGSEPPVVWLGDLETLKAELIWTVTCHDEPSPGSFRYVAPSRLAWSPHSARLFALQCFAPLSDEFWVVNTAEDKSDQLPVGETPGRFAPELLAWTEEGIVIQRDGLIQLLSPEGQLTGEMALDQKEPTSVTRDITNVGVNWPVPHIHQKYDTAESFAGKLSACGPTSELMALAYMGRLSKNTMWVDNGGTPGYHSTDFGWYVSNTYAQSCACDAEQHTYTGGAYPACTTGDSGDYDKMQQFAWEHDVGYWTKFGNFSLEKLQHELDAGAIVLVDTWLTDYGHIIVVRGWYRENGVVKFIANDPYGDHATGDPGGEGVGYTWEEINPAAQAPTKWYLVLYPPEILPDVRSIDAVHGTTITITTGGHYVGFAPSVQVCLMNTNGTRNRVITRSLNPSASTDVSLPAEFGSTPWEGSAIIRTGSSTVNAVAVTEPPGDQDPVAVESIRSIYGESVSGGGVGSTLHLPSALYNYYGWYTHLYVQNVSGRSTTATVQYYLPNGSTTGTARVVNLAPFQRVYFIPYDHRAPLGKASARITSSNDELLAATVQHKLVSGENHMLMEYSLPNAAGEYGFLPSVLKNYYHWTSAYILQADSASVNSRSTLRPSGYYRDSTLGNGNASEEVYLGDWAAIPDNFCNAGVTDKTGENGLVVTSSQHSNPIEYTAMGFRSAREGLRELTMPLIDTEDGKTCAIVVQNASPGVTMDVTVKYYDSAGNLNALQPTIYNLTFGQAVELVVQPSQVPADFRGSVWLQSSVETGRIVANVQVSSSNNDGYGYSQP